MAKKISPIYLIGGAAILYIMTRPKKPIPHSHDEQLTKNFTLKEFHSKDGADMPYDVYLNIKKLALALQEIRDIHGAPITINSGYRSPEHNANTENAASNSYHMKGMAADISTKDVGGAKELRDIAAQLIGKKKIPQGGIGSYKTFTHYDIRGTKQRW